MTIEIDLYRVSTSVPDAAHASCPFCQSTFFPHHGLNKLLLHRLYVQVIPELETDISGIASRHQNK